MTRTEISDGAAPELDRGKEIVVVGRGMAGWLAALFLRQHLPSNQNVTILGDPEAPPLSVGESVNGAVMSFLERVGVSLTDLIRECGATAKIATEFRGWTPDGYDWVHEFEPTSYAVGLPLYHFWLSLHRRGRMREPYPRACFTCGALLERQRLPIEPDSHEGWFPIGAHFKVPDLIRVLEHKGRAQAITIRDGRVSALDLGADGYIRSVRLSDGAVLPADFVIDCTGPACAVRSLAGTAAWVTEAERLLCNRAVATSIPRQGNTRPSTVSCRLPSGWMWWIPLADRWSVGYAYSGDLETDEAAAAELLRRGNDARINAAEAQLVRLQWTPRRLAEPWAKNCVALGLASCMLEPLESLTSATLVFELHQLLLHFPGERPFAPLSRRYNRAVSQLHESNVDFLSLIYLVAAPEKDGFWWEVTRLDRASNRAQEVLCDFRDQAPPSVTEIYDDKALFGLFTAAGIIPRHDLPLASFLPEAAVQPELDRIARIRGQIIQRSVGHDEFIADALGA